MVRTFLKYLLPLVVALSGNAFAASSEFRVPPLTSPVVDDANVLSPGGRAQIERLIRALFESGGSQLSVLTVPSLNEMTIEEVSIKVVDAWQLGRKGKDDGLLLLIAPNERRLRIEVGRGKEGELPDALARRIINEVITPAFKTGDFDRGALLGVAAIIQYTDPTFNLSEYGAPARVSMKRQGSGHSIPPFFIFLVLVIVFSSLPFILKILTLLGLANYSSRDRWGGGGGWSGGGGGGSWGGGGGGFSGGGSSGSW